MKTRLPIQAKSTEFIIKAIIPEEFKIANDSTSNGYKYINLLYGVEVDQFRNRLQEVYDNSFLETMDLAQEGILYEVYLSGIPNSQYLNTSTPGTVPIKITNWTNTGGDSEFWDGSPTRVLNNGVIYISGIVQSGNIVGLNYFRENASGYGYFLINTNIDQSEYLNLSGSAWQVNLDNVGTIIDYTGLWPGVKTFDYDEQGRDEILYPLGSGYLSRTYPLTRRIKDESGIYWDIDHYEPYSGWVRDVDGNVVANNNYQGDYYYNNDGKKIYYRTAYNNPYGSGNYTVEYLPLRNIPISGTVRLYDIDILDYSGNATEIPATGIDLYRLQSSNMLIGEATGVFDPIYVGYYSGVPYDQGFGAIEGLPANYLITTSWAHQYGTGYVDDETMTYIEDNGDINKYIKITNPVTRYMAEYKYKEYSQANYITSLEATKYISYSTPDPLYSIKNIFNNEEQLEYSFTKDPAYKEEPARFITFDGWKTRPGVRISKIDFSFPLTIKSGPLTSFIAVAGRKTHAGYSAGFVPDITSSKDYILNCPFDILPSGSVTEDDLSGSGNYLVWNNTGSNEIYRIPIEDNYGKRIKYVNNSGYYFINSENFLKDNTFFRFKFRAYTPQTLTLMELSEATDDNYIKVQVSDKGMISIISNGVEYYYSFNLLQFGNQFHDILIRYHPDQEYTDNPVFDLYINGPLGYTKPRQFLRETTAGTYSSTYLHVYQDCSIDVDLFQIYYETDYGYSL